MRTVSINICQYAELNDTAKEKAREWFRGCLDESDMSFTVESITEVGALLGIVIDNLYYGGFYTQRQGASFTGSYAFQPGWRSRLKKYYGPTAEYPGVELLGQTLHEVAAQSFYAITAKITPHHRSVGISVEVPYEYEALEGKLAYALDCFNHWAFDLLLEQYDYINSDEYIVGGIEGNEYEFTEDGERYCG